MKFRLLSAAAAAALGAASATAADPDAGPKPGQGGSDDPQDGDPKPADKPKTTDTPSDAGSAADPAASVDQVDVVAASDVATLTAQAEKKGFAAANARMKTVFDSAEGKAQAHTAAFLLATSEASADDIIGHLKGQAPAASTAPAIPDTKTDIKTDPAALAGADAAAGDVNKQWDDVFAEQAAADAPIVPAAHVAAAAGAHTISAGRAIPRTGN